jgi:hypothetical protein
MAHAAQADTSSAWLTQHACRYAFPPLTRLASPVEGESAADIRPYYAGYLPFI